MAADFAWSVQMHSFWTPVEECVFLLSGRQIQVHSNHHVVRLEKMKFLNFFVIVTESKSAICIPVQVHNIYRCITTT